LQFQNKINLETPYRQNLKTTATLNSRHAAVLSNILPHKTLYSTAAFPPVSYCNTNVALTLATDNLQNNNLNCTTVRKSGKDICAENQMLANPLLKLQLKDEKQNAGRIKCTGMWHCVMQ